MVKREDENGTPHRKFVIEFLDPLTKCITDESIIEITDIADLCEMIDPEIRDIHPAAVYDLELSDIVKISTRFGVVFQGVGKVGRLRSWRAVDALPYKVHTNRELALMLSGDKPLAVFSEMYPSNPEHETIPEGIFEPHVIAGLFVKRECFLSEGDRTIRMVLYATNTEQWRMDAYILLKTTAGKTGWNEGFEYMEGLLLGYEEWQNDYYIEKIYRGTKG